jgi:hypothetical protein
MLDISKSKNESKSQRAGIAAGWIFYNVQPGIAAQLKTKS